MILKDNISFNYKTIHSDAWTYIKQECLNGIGDQSFLIRTTNCVIISIVLERMGLHFWPELLPTLCEFLNSSEHSVREVIQHAFIRANLRSSIPYTILSNLFLFLLMNILYKTNTTTHTRHNFSIS